MNCLKITNYKLKIDSGFTLVEMVVGATVFALIAISVFGGYSSLINLVGAGKTKIMAADIANAEFELIRNVPYANVGLVNGIPTGVLLATSTVTQDNFVFQITRTIRNIDDPFDGTLGGAPNDLSPADYKMIEIEVACASCKNFIPHSIVGRVAPKNLETASTNGALFIRVFDANGNPVPQASVQVTKSSNPQVSIDDLTDNNGLLAIVDAPPGVNAYRIIVTKAGYTTDQTYATSTSNPNPQKPDATVIIQQVTQISFVIDKVSQLNVRSKDILCGPVGDVPFTLTGSKLIGINPDVLKFPATNYTTNSSGNKIFSNLEWDTFYLNLNGGGFYLAGTNPILPLSILPDSTQDLDLIVTLEPPNYLLVSVKDNTTQLPISGAYTILNSQTSSFSKTLQTGRGYMEQSDWSGGSGQANFIDPSMFWSDDGNIDTNSPVGELKLLNSLGHYSLSGSLTSSIFDTGTTSNFSNISWSPTAQPPEAGANSARFQIATALLNTGTTTWNYLGPDGTTATYYDLSDTNINAVHNGDRYFRYKAFLSTVDDNYTPNVASIGITFTSACNPPGQSLFSNLSLDDYELIIEKAGYALQTIATTTNAVWTIIDVNLSP